jgi:hypothetical protein
MDAADPRQLFDNDEHLEDYQDCLFPDHEPGTTASEFDGALDESNENEEDGEGQKDGASESEPEIRTRRSSAKKVSPQFNFNLAILIGISFVDWALEARCCTYLRGIIMSESMFVTQCIYYLKVPKWKSKSHARATTKVIFSEYKERIHQPQHCFLFLST